MKWRDMTETQERELLDSCKPGEVVVFHGDDLVKTTLARIEQIYRDACNAAIREASGQLGIASQDEIDEVEIEGWKFGQTFVRITVIKGDQRATAACVLEDPRSGTH